nr:16S rRNA (cytosine(967)-C(5))-methyltransferase RsmB [uncultured Acetatifactor sp.]
MGENTRQIVVDTLLELERDQEYSHNLIKAVLDKYDYLDGRDKAFIKRVAEGTTERKIELDYYLEKFSSVPVRKMKPLIRVLLRMSLYQLLYMDGVPDSAVCNEACKIAAKRGFADLKGFVNGVLRNLARNKERLPLPDRGKDEAGYFSVKYSMPRLITQMWLDEYGREITETLLRKMLEPQPVSIRFRTGFSEEERLSWLDKIRTVQAKAVQSPYLPYVYTVKNAEGIRTLPGFGEGAFTVQDVSSALAVEAAGIEREDFVLDVCAAPGGKTLLAAEKGARVLARDVSGRKTALIRENLDRMKTANVMVQVFDGCRTDSSLHEKADVILLDVPCSGLGVLGKKRDIKYHVDADGLKSLEGLQKRILEQSWRYVKPGGILLYSTCTIRRQENQDMFRYILDHFPFEPDPIAPYLPEKLLRERDALEELLKKQRRPVLSEEEGAACIQLMPGYMESDGFFMARLRRRSRPGE